MSLKTKSLVFGLMAAGALFAVGAAQAGASLVSMKHGAMPNFATKAFVSDSGSGVLNTPVNIDGWGFIDQVKCVQIGVPQPFVVPTSDKYGTWSSMLESSTLGSGACPGVSFMFSAITYTETTSVPGAVDNKRMAALTTAIQKKYRHSFGLGRHAKIVDFVSVTIN